MATQSRFPRVLLKLRTLFRGAEVDRELDQAHAARAQAKAHLDLARVTADRYNSLLKEDAVSPQEVDEKYGIHQARKADYAAAEANIRRLEQMNDVRVRSRRERFAKGKDGFRNGDPHADRNPLTRKAAALSCRGLASMSRCRISATRQIPSGPSLENPSARR